MLQDTGLAILISHAGEMSGALWLTITAMFGGIALIMWLHDRRNRK